MLRAEAFTVLNGLQVRVAVHCLGHDDREVTKCEGWELSGLVAIEQIEQHGVVDATWMTVGRLLEVGPEPAGGDRTTYASVEC